MTVAYCLLRLFYSHLDVYNHKIIRYVFADFIDGYKLKPYNYGKLIYIFLISFAIVVCTLTEGTYC